MTKREFTILEKVFASEINGGLYQGKCKTVKKLEEEGYVQLNEKLLGRDCFGTIKVTGYITTIKGNLHYCMSCKEEVIT